MALELDGVALFIGGQTCCAGWEEGGPELASSPGLTLEESSLISASRSPAAPTGYLWGDCHEEEVMGTKTPHTEPGCAESTDD